MTPEPEFRHGGKTGALLGMGVGDYAAADPGRGCKAPIMNVSLNELPTVADFGSRTGGADFEAVGGPGIL